MRTGQYGRHTCVRAINQVADRIGPEPRLLFALTFVDVEADQTPRADDPLAHRSARRRNAGGSGEQAERRGELEHVLSRDRMQLAHRAAIIPGAASSSSRGESLST